MMNFLLVLFAFLFMEFVAWSNHKYIMHGFLWRWHADHHRKDHTADLPEQTEDKRFEKNDLFFLVYALPAIVLMIIGLMISAYSLVYISIGITLYGFTYFVIHDIIIHKRIHIPFLQNRQNSFIRSIVKAHRAHHWPKNRSDFNNFGLLVFHIRYFKS
jgi:beta-carotene 3-hydroxylase